MCLELVLMVTENSAVCEEMSEQRQKDICYKNLVEEFEAEDKYCAQIKSEDIKDSCYIKSAINAYDPEVCKNINEGTNRGRCYEYIALFGDGDISVCELIKQTDIKNRCKEHLLNRQH